MSLQCSGTSEFKLPDTTYPHVFVSLFLEKQITLGWKCGSLPFFSVSVLSLQPPGSGICVRKQLSRANISEDFKNCLCKLIVFPTQRKGARIFFLSLSCLPQWFRNSGYLVNFLKWIKYYSCCATTIHCTIISLKAYYIELRDLFTCIFFSVLWLFKRLLCHICYCFSITWHRTLGL